MQAWLSSQGQCQELGWSGPFLESDSLELSLELGLCSGLLRVSPVPEAELLSPGLVPRFPESDLWFQAEPCPELVLILEWLSFLDSCFAQLRCFAPLSIRRDPLSVEI